MLLKILCLLVAIVEGAVVLPVDGDINPINDINPTRRDVLFAATGSDSTCDGHCPPAGTSIVACANPLECTCASACNCWKHACCC
mmetsp:Transcript_1213/g.3893  ORF Transcript_1213/g.3893 Transcript_1213/m.3893 type:complete len:85 (-) Transcript_1213:167-421(-)